MRHPASLIAQLTGSKALRPSAKREEAPLKGRERRMREGEGASSSRVWEQREGEEEGRRLRGWERWSGKEEGEECCCCLQIWKRR